MCSIVYKFAYKFIVIVFQLVQFFGKIFNIRYRVKQKLIKKNIQTFNSLHNTP